MRRMSLRLVIAGTVLVASASCGGGGSSGSPASPSGSANALTITIMRQNGNQSFAPNPASAGGQTVVFRNADSVVHRVVLPGGVDTGDIAPGATSQPVQIPSAGTNYHCSLHPTMVGAVNAAGGGEPPPCVGDYCGGSEGTY